MPSSACPPDQNTGPPGREPNIESILRQLNTNMGTMTQLLTEVCARLPTGNIDASSSSRSPLGTGKEGRRRRSVAPPLMSPRRTRMSPGANQGERTIPSVCMPQMMVLHRYWPNDRFAQQPPIKRMLRARTSCLRNS